MRKPDPLFLFYWTFFILMRFFLTEVNSEPASTLVDKDTFKIWWCGGTEKIFPETQSPTPVSKKVTLAAARNEFEPFQLVLRSTNYLNHVSVAITAFTHETTQKSADFKPEICLVEYVSVKIPSDSAGRSGEWPDPLPPYTEPFKMSPQRNFPLWITFYIPRNTAAGFYSGEIVVSHSEVNYQIPVQIHVRDFELPAMPTIRSGFELSPKLIARYHNLNPDSAELDSVLDKYFKNMAEHRVCPYNPMMRHPVKIMISPKWAMTATDSIRQPLIALDFRDFDRTASRYLDTLGFNSFRLELQGIGKGSFHNRQKGTLAGFEQDSEEYTRLFRNYVSQLTEHLQKRNWLEKAYLYWFDEPAEKDYSYVCESNAKIREAAPHLKLFLTEEPSSELAGCVDIWCLAPQYFNQEEISAAQSRGEEIWWYLCTNPKAPFPTLFIDATAINLRMWLWMTWKFQLDGILVWQSVYWHSETAFGTQQFQNPWQDPMSYLTGYDVPSGEKRYWGNGDGRFFYPPNRNVNLCRLKYLEGPINSIRWEVLREGIEDYEYFALLQKKLAALKVQGNQEKIYQSGIKLLDIPASIITSPAHFTKEIQSLLTYRQEIANAIEEVTQLVEQ